MTRKRKPVGGAISDENGGRSWVWQDGDQLDTTRVRALGEGLSLDAAHAQQKHVRSDPYNREPAPAAPKKRRTLDDMRTLSEVIKNSKHWKRGV
jgi:hypothetical protein